VSRNPDFLLEAGELRQQLGALRDELCVAPEPTVRLEHLAAMDSAMVALGCPVAATPSDRVRSRRLHRLALPVAATVSVLGLTCGLAAAGALPGPAQRQISRVADAIGWNIPSSGGASNEGQSGGSGIRNIGTIAPAATTAPAAAQPAGSGSRGPSTTTLPASAIPPAPAVPHGQVHPKAEVPGSGSGNNTETDRDSLAPGKSGDAPGRTQSTADDSASGTPPGRSGGNNGRSGEAPGQNIGP
jgi:hypothetical protein